jgi:hypothetical protein
MLRLADCTGGTSGTGLWYEWPADVEVAGIRTDGGGPCRSGRGCSVGGPPQNVATSAPRDRAVLETRIQGVWPNPSTGRTTTQFELADPSVVELAVYDVRGRLVRSLFQGNLAAGVYTVDWDGRDSSSQRVAGGIYFQRLRMGGREFVERVIVVR